MFGGGYRNKRTKSDCDPESLQQVEAASSIMNLSLRSALSCRWHRHDYHIAMISVLLLIPVYLLVSIQNTSQLAETLNSFSFTESDVSERFLLSKSVPSLKECKNPLRMAVPLLVSEQNFALRQPAITSASIPAKKKPPRVCIVVTTFNVVEYVGIAVESVLKQTYQNVEIIVVDDNSNDGTTDLLLNKYATEPPGPDAVTPTLQVVRLTHNTNGGAGQPSNIGIDSCSEYTDYVMFADGDDYMELDAVETMLAHAEIFNSDVVMADFDVVRFGATTGMTLAPEFPRLTHGLHSYHRSCP
jgi:hypothetical protein